jgi:hypothetical protein
MPSVCALKILLINTMAFSWQIVGPTSADKGVSRGQRCWPSRPIISVLYTRTSTYSFKWLLIYPHEAE